VGEETTAASQPPPPPPPLLLLLGGSAARKAQEPVKEEEELSSPALLLVPRSLPDFDAQATSPVPKSTKTTSVLLLHCEVSASTDSVTKGRSGRLAAKIPGKWFGVSGFATTGTTTRGEE